MGIIKPYLLWVTKLSPILRFFWGIIYLLVNLYSVPAMAHDPGLSFVNIELNRGKLSTHIIFARKDLERFVQLDKHNFFSIDDTHIEDRQIKLELTQFILSAVELYVAEKKLPAEIIDIEVDTSDAVHFKLDYLTVTGESLLIHSSMIDKFSPGHRQIVKVRKNNQLVNSRILSARQPRFQLDLPELDQWSQFLSFMIDGVWHIWIGFDHILFIITLILPAVLLLNQKQWQPQSNLKQIIKQTVYVISAFTVAHSLTLALTVFDVISLPIQIIESVIAASVIIAAFNNIFIWVNQRLWLLAFVFGLVHGMGFASVLNEIGLYSYNQLITVIGFNLGVELGQIVIISIILPVLYSLRKYRFYKPVLMQSGSMIIIVIASMWFLERISEISIS